MARAIGSQDFLHQRVHLGAGIPAGVAAHHACHRRGRHGRGVRLRHDDAVRLDFQRHRRDATLDAVDVLKTCEMDYLVMGMSAITFYGGVAGGDAFKRQVEELAGVGASTGSESTVAALRAYGGIKRVSFVSPYYPVANAEVRRYLAECGFETVRDVPLQCRCWTDIAKVSPERLVEVIEHLDGDDVDAIVQVGTNLSMVQLAADKEKELGKPVIAINTATYWHALRALGINDRIAGLGRLLEEF